jgi:hypothetical protein
MPTSLPLKVVSTTYSFARVRVLNGDLLCSFSCRLVVATCTRGLVVFLPRLPENLARAAPLPLIASNSTDRQCHGSSGTAWKNGLVKESYLYRASMVLNKDLIQDPPTCLRNFVTWLVRRSTTAITHRSTLPIEMDVIDCLTTSSPTCVHQHLLWRPSCCYPS